MNSHIDELPGDQSHDIEARVGPFFGWFYKVLRAKTAEKRKNRKCVKILFKSIKTPSKSFKDRSGALPEPPQNPPFKTEHVKKSIFLNCLKKMKLPLRNDPHPKEEFK